MPPRTFIVVALVLGVNSIGASTGFAAKTATAPAKMPMHNSGHSLGKKGKQNAKPTPEAQHTTISLINSDSITIASGKDTKTYKIDQETQIELKGSRATVADLKPGMRVSITPGVDSGLAGLILASDPPTATTTASNNKGKK